MDMISTVRRLTAIAKTTPSEATKSPGTTTASSSPAGSFLVQDVRLGVMVGGGLGKGSCKARSWKPLLDPIREMSFPRRSDSDLQKENWEVA